MLRRSQYRFRYLFACLISVLLIAMSSFIMLDTFVFAKEAEPLMPVASLTFTPVPTKPDATPIPRLYTDTQYSDEHIQLSVKKVSQKNLTYFVADIKLDSVQYFKAAFAKDKYGLNIHETTSSMAKRKNAILAINGDYCGYSKEKLTLRNGTLYNDNFDDEVLVLMMDGSMRIAPADETGQQMIDSGALHAWSFGPTLVEDSKYANKKTSSHVTAINPRTGIGMIEPLHYIFIVVDGRSGGYSNGLLLPDFANLFIEYGCKVAYNLDGGGSSEMVMNNKIVNVPCEDGERATSDILYIGE